ncbi:MAG TPA: universal stress protein [Myxococcota bacterium]|nr:universal stress protein [Myxococcota bacterium]
MQDPPFVTSVFHPTDFSEGSHLAFAHALAIALLRETELTILHAGRDFLAEDEWTKFPAVRRTLEAWGCLEPGSPRSAVLEELNVRVKKVNLRSLRPAAAIHEYVTKHDIDLVVLATESGGGLPAWLDHSVSERVAREARLMTLFVPAGARGFVNPGDGSIHLTRVLIPVAAAPSAKPAIVYATRIAQFAAKPVELVLLHVGDGPMPTLDRLADPQLRFREERRSGDVIDEIERAARDLDVDLIAMTTDGRDGFLGVLGRGSHTERVVRRAPCPVLAVPVGKP